MIAPLAHRMRLAPTVKEKAEARARLTAVAKTLNCSVADLLKQHGWSGEGDVSNDVIADAIEATENVKIVETAIATTRPEEEPKKPTLRERRLDLGMMMNTRPQPIDMVLDGLQIGTLGVILGSGSVGKSMAVISVAAAVANGVDLLGCLLPENRVTEHGRVVYLAGEDDAQVIHHRIHAFAATLEQEHVAAFSGRVDIVSLVGTAPTLLDGKGALNTEAIMEIREAAKGTRLLVIDPLRQFHAADENDNSAMTVLSKALAQIAHEEHCSIILVHHVSKAGAKDDERDASMSRGASAITDNARWVMALKKLSESAMEDHGLLPPAWQYVTARKVKANYVALGDVTILQRGDGGILAPAQVVRRDIVREIISGMGGTMEASEKRMLPRTADDLLEMMGDDDAA